jgi:hypothetical protein
MSAPAAKALALPVMTMAPIRVVGIESQQGGTERVHQGVVQRVELPEAG